MQVVATKLLIPPDRPGTVTRTRLLRLLDVVPAHPVTLVTAPAGFGKTTLVSAWLRDFAGRAAWLTLDEDDDVPGRFLEHLATALAASRTLLDSGTASTPAVMTELVNELVGAERVLVLDDVNVLAEPENLDALTFLVEHCPPGVHLVLLGRTEPDLPLARWRGRGLLAEVGATQLRFTPDEAAGLLTAVAGREVDVDTVGELNRRAEGWAAALQLLGIGLRDGTAAAPSVRLRPGNRYVLDYLAEEVVGRQPADVREFLLRTSVLETLTPSLCDAVTGRSDSDRVIRDLERANLFLTPVDDAGEWHRYHGLFADYLRGELAADVAVECHARAARWFSAEGMPAETIRHAVPGHELGLAVATVREQAEDQVRRGELATLLSWLNRLPEDEVRAHPDLAGFKGWLLYLAGRADEAEAYAAIADAGMGPAAPVLDRAMLRTFQAYLALTHGRPADAAGLATAALDLLGDSTSFFRAAALGVLGQARRLTGDRRGAIEVLRQAVRLGERSGNPLSALEATGYLAPLLYVQGRLREAILLCRDALRAHGGAPMAGLAEVPLGTLLYERDELVEARTHLVDGIARCEQLGTTSYTLLGLRTLARLHHASGRVDAGFEALLAARRQADAAEDYRRARLVVATIAELHLRSGNSAAAEQALAEITRDQPSSSDYEQLTRARLLIARGSPTAALDVLGVIEDRARAEGRDGSLVAILVVSALARRGEPARELLARAVEIAAPDGYRRTFLDEGPALVPLVKDVRATVPEFVTDLLSRSRGAPAGPARGSELRTVEGVGVVETLTETQRRILGLIATGMSNRQVADKLFITVGTTKWHLNQIFGRLQARNRTEAVARARELNLL
ncbi:LuxR family transcriptional regulator [Amycolatopsis mediterranei S699]|uniref:LuxR family transcriptional regulator n=1 Tax=Amycolatopsis mediterranei (strain S699) TaxID=713604 RepID=A0A9R0UBV4_AMYMS|nr:LuxR C-terminal-related transcriptional regulator [Amycolatopsis mediterranei]AEK45105.1 LuxR family transcriptional regulator [Amycolatopsis mediterranei S699]AFO79910.1 LuxR family transcriptional regulator [Amycolatopsis mediterranei S699]